MLFGRRSQVTIFFEVVMRKVQIVFSQEQAAKSSHNRSIVSYD
jgi:hypothetical protein